MNSWLRRAVLRSLTLGLCWTHVLGQGREANRLEFLEGFAWGDRAAALKDLAPNTEDFFYYHCLHHQLNGDRAAFDRTMTQWLAHNRERWNDRMREMRRRQMLLDFDRQPDRTWTFLREDFNLTFSHRPRHEQRSRRYPSRIDPKQYGFDAFMKEASGPQFLDRLTLRGLDLAMTRSLSGEQRRALLGRLTRADYPGLVEMVLADLETKDSRGFGHHNVHRLMTKAQLEDLGRRRPALSSEDAYVTERLLRIPVPDADLARDPEAAAGYYSDLWDFVRTLGPAHNSLKASVLHSLLDYRQRQGVYDETLFRQYLALPRRVAYLPRAQRLQWQRQRVDWVNFSYRPQAGIVLPPIGNEEPLVRDYLIELLRTRPDPSGYSEHFETRWLDAVFAESKILHGIGKPEDWSSRLTPAAYRALLDRVDLNFAPGNPSRIRPGDPVTLQVDVKRVDRLLVKIHEIQTFNYYTTRRAPVDQAVELDGLIAAHERTLEVAADPGRRIRHTLALPEITRRGVYVVELIGGGVSSRALLHVGRLEAIAQPVASGLAAMVLDDTGRTVKNAAIWLDGREFEANEHGLILIPFSEKPGPRFVVLRDGDFCSPDTIVQPDEAYVFNAGIHLDPQNLRRNSVGTLMLRPDLRLHGMPLDPALLGEVQVTLASTDAQGVRSERRFSAEFARHAEWARSFHVPDNLRKLEVAVEAKLKRRSDLEEITLSDHYALDVNSARAQDTLRQIFAVPTADGWFVAVRGLNGETAPDMALNMEFYHPGFTQPVRAQATTDARGRVALGPLADLSRIVATGPDNLRLDLPLAVGATVYPERMHLTPGESVSLPYPYARTRGLGALSLFRTHNDKPMADVSDKARIADGQVVLTGLTPGEYTLNLHRPGARVVLEVREGEVRNGFILGATRRLQQSGVRLPSVAGIRTGKGEATVALRHVTSSTRVAARLSRFGGPGAEFPEGQGFTEPVHRRMLPFYAQYASGRNIGDEYRYVLDRRLHARFAGSLLERPGLILNPWELRETETDQERLKADEAYRADRQRMSRHASRPSPKVAEYLRLGRPGALRGEPPLLDIGFDFLPQGSVWHVNLQPDADGTVRIPLGNGDEHTALDVVIVDRFGTSRTRHLLPDREMQPRDARLLSGLNPDASFSRQKTVQAIGPGQPAVFPDAATSRYQVFGTFAQAFDVLHTLGGHADLKTFAFLKDWSGLDEERKRELYGEHACHELHLFLYMRDRAFFDAVVRPYLLHKKDKTFVDRWLLETLTPEDTRLDRLQRRNALELALLARRGGDAAAIQAAMREVWELLPPDPEAFARRVRVALQTADLDEAVAQAREEVRERARRESETLRSMPGARPARPAVATEAVMDAFSPAPAELDAVAMLKSPVLSLREETIDEPGIGEDRAVMLMDAEGMADPFGGVVRLYRALPKTKEWAERNYWRVRVKDETPDRVAVNRFWRDVAAGAEVSAHMLEAHGSLTETLAALAFCGLPFEAVEPEETLEGARLSLTVRTPALLVAEQILPAALSKDDRPLLLSQQFYRPDDPYRFEGAERIEKFVAGEFVRRTVYGARVTLTNPTASRRRLNVLLQIPQGAMPVRNGFYTDDVSMLLEPYTTSKIEYFFTFPESGTFMQFPAHAAADEAIAGRADPRMFTVVDAPTEVDKTSWGWISQHASAADVLDYLGRHNVRRLNLDEMAWRLRDRRFFEQATDLLTARGHVQDTVFSYAIHHRDAERARIWLARSRARFGVGPVFASALLTVEPVEEKTYEHLEYDPLVNPRAHPVGDRRIILNAALNTQYRAYLRTALYRNALDASERLALVYYLLLQDRLEEAGTHLARIREADLQETLQADYLKAWLALRRLELDRALALAQPYAEHSVPRWRARFRAVIQAVREARGEAVGQDADDPTRQQDMDRHAVAMPSLELRVESGRLMAAAHNLKRATLNLYPMDIELLFSRRPFLTERGADFAVVRPAFAREVALRGDGELEPVALPPDWRDRNLMVELVGQGQRASAAWYANRLRVRRMESYGQIEVRLADDNTPLPKTYVKVFARSVDGRESFWKDGYTDVRGRFDYASRNDRKPEEANEFAILILHSEHGAEIRTARPPAR